jgi:hypothetical protein
MVPSHRASADAEALLSFRSGWDFFEEFVHATLEDIGDKVTAG